jgi:Sec-independent protein translocase protein TatA
MHAALFAQILGPDGMVVVAVVAIVLLLGGAQLPKLARSLGVASHELKHASKELTTTVKEGAPAARPAEGRPR